MSSQVHLWPQTSDFWASFAQDPRPELGQPGGELVICLCFPMLIGPTSRLVSQSSIFPPDETLSPSGVADISDLTCWTIVGHIH